MSNELTPQQSFQEKMKERITKDLGDLIPDEMLQELVNKALEEAFFKPRKVRVKSGYSEKYESMPSWFEDYVGELLKPMMQKAVDDWIAKPETLERIIEEIQPFVERSTDQVIMSALSNALSKAITNMGYDIQNDLSQRIQNATGRIV